MLLESIKDITKDGRIVVKDGGPGSGPQEGGGKKNTSEKEKSEAKGTISRLRNVLRTILEDPKLSDSKKEKIAKEYDERIFNIKRNYGISDSQYTKSEYTEMLARLQRQLQQAKSLGDTEEAKELQKEIDDLKALESGVQDDWSPEAREAALEARRKGSSGKSDNKEVSNLNGRISEVVAAIKRAGAQGDEKRVKQLNINLSDLKDKLNKAKSNDTEAKITDLTEKAKAARAQGYAADQYEAEIEKLKALDKKTKDESAPLVGKKVIVNAGKYKDAPGTIIDLGGGANGATIKMDSGEKAWIARIDFEVKDSTKDSPRDNIERQIDELEDELEDATGKKKSDIQAKIKELEKQLESVNDAYDEVDWLTLDPLTEKGKEILASMKKEYGDERGEKIFYASKNAGKITGVDSK